MMKTVSRRDLLPGHPTRERIRVKTALKYRAVAEPVKEKAD